MYRRHINKFIHLSISPHPTRGFVGCSVSRGRAEPGEKRFYCFLSVSERLSLQRLLKINVVHSRSLLEKNGFAQWVGSDLIELKSNLVHFNLKI